ncbi:calcium-activated chloride channel regulator 4A-like [Strongylocentrotus purpuratus]|uniref:VWFA domain-containing protein n=1 Tax=Strongylocentrotus purpuratus TaxID=7668 RepID=A0A7M7SVV2_STRPU|nr:calcium-activated chloride channel regulator 4A-like [Strongylocentrotus purpuratus]
MLVERLSLLLFFSVGLMGTKICKAQQDRNPIELENGAYNNILIAISKDVEEDSSIIQNIKDIFRAGSSILFNATNLRVYLGTITILVPPTWSRNSEYQVAQREAYENANVLVTDQQSNHRPFVDKPFKCGQQGRFMHLSKTFLVDQALRENQFGDSGKVIVRQFAKLRWGVFDEDYVPGTGAEPYYQLNSNTVTGGVFEGTRCSSKVLGDLLDENERQCRQDPSGYLPDSCRFVPHASGQTARASLMFASNIHSIDMFCHDDPGNVGYHNYMAPNLQNKKCDYQSVWQLMRKSTDFMNGNSPSLPEDTDTSPNFIVVQPAGSLRIVLVLDTSFSMDGPRFNKMIRGAKNFIQSIVPNNSYVAIVEFNSVSKVNSNMIELSSVISRKNLASLLPTVAENNTCIGCGILTAIEVAQYNGLDSRGVYLILLSDGQENIYEDITLVADTLDDIESSGVTVHSIAFYGADTQLEELAQMTGGRSATCADGGSSQCVISAFVSIIAQSPQSVATSAPIQVQSSTITLDPGTTKTTDIVIDDSLGLDTVITITWTANDIITVTVRGPDGTVIDSTDARYETDISSKIITVTIIDAEAGVWSIEINNDGNPHMESVSVDVISKPRSDGVYPPVVNSFLGTSIVYYTTAPLLEVYAYVHINYVPVIDATVIAEVVSSTTGDVTTISLLDNGLGADLIAGDGIYSAYFLDFSSNGRYGVKVDVNGYTANSSESALRSKRDTGTLTTPVPSLRFQRTTTAGVFQVENYSPDLIFDILAPSKITDITSRERTYDENRNVTLTWSAVGDDLDQGTAAYYELRFSDNFTQIRTNFTSAAAVNDTDLILGNLSRVASSGTLESITILLPGQDSDAIFSFMIRAWDEAGNAGPLSNIVSVSRRSLPPTTMPTTILNSTSEPPSTQSPGVALPIWVVISFSCAAFFIVIAVSIIVGVLCNRSAPKNPIGSVYEHTNPAYECYEP